MGATKKFQSKCIEYYDAEKLYKLKFQDTAYVIAKMDPMKKASIVAEINPILDSLYNMANRYGNSNYGRDEQPTAEQFRGIMSKIKHWETLLFWLFEIDLLMAEDDIQKLIDEAQEEIDRLDEETDAEELLKRREKLDAAKDKYKAHTDEIQSMASALTRKFFS